MTRSLLLCCLLGIIAVVAARPGGSHSRPRPHHDQDKMLKCEFENEAVARDEVEFFFAAAAESVTDLRDTVIDPSCKVLGELAALEASNVDVSDDLEDELDTVRDDLEDWEDDYEEVRDETKCIRARAAHNGLEDVEDPPLCARRDDESFDRKCIEAEITRLTENEDEPSCRPPPPEDAPEGGDGLTKLRRALTKLRSSMAKRRHGGGDRPEPTAGNLSERCKCVKDALNDFLNMVPSGAEAGINSMLVTSWSLKRLKDEVKGLAGRSHGDSASVEDQLPEPGAQTALKRTLQSLLRAINKRQDDGEDTPPPPPEDGDTPDSLDAASAKSAKSGKGRPGGPGGSGRGGSRSRGGPGGGEEAPEPTEAPAKRSFKQLFAHIF